MIIFISFILYLQNYLFLLFYQTGFQFSILEFSILFLMLSLFSKSDYFKVYIIILESFYFTHFAFIAYFGALVCSSDIYLFFTHITETFETFSTLHETLFFPFLLVLATSLIILSIRYTKSRLPTFLLLILLFFSFLFQEKTHDASLVLLKESVKTLLLKEARNSIQKSNKKEILPFHKTDNTLVLVIGESMRSREHLKERYEIFENYSYKTIFSGATNTDVSIPLLINGGISPQKIDLEENLFLLAKKNGYKTSFITTQNEKSLKYIEPYLHKEYIDNFKILGSRDDKELISHLKNISLEEKNFIVLQMQGEHSPYIYYENANRDDSIIQRYHKSMQYSDTILRQLIALVSNSSKKSFLLIFTSDHGEMLGEEGKTGHNRFEKEIYSVPLVIHSNLEMHLEKIVCHGDVYGLLYHYLGYTQEFMPKERKTVRVYGTMITEEDGYRDIDIQR